MKKWPVRKGELERSYEWVGDPNRLRVRPDIELLGDDDETIVVVECKARGVPAGRAVKRQALDYAQGYEGTCIWKNLHWRMGRLGSVPGSYTTCIADRTTASGF